MQGFGSLNVQASLIAVPSIIELHMHSKYIKNLHSISACSGVAISILVGFYDVILGYIWEIIHIVLEIIEITLDGLIEHSFETEVHETQVIVFYIMLAIGGFLFIFYGKPWLMYLQA